MTSRWRGRRSRVSPSSGRTPTPDAPQGMCLDKGYDYDEVRELLDRVWVHRPHPGAGGRGPSAEAGSRFKARRWVVERTHSWMNRFRRVLIRWDKNVRNYLGFLHLACAYITYRQSGLLG